MCRPRVIRITGDKHVSREVTTRYSSQPLELCGIDPFWDKPQYPCPLLTSTSVPGWFFFSLLQGIALCSQSQMFISMLEPVWPDNAITSLRTPNSHFLHTKWAILMLMWLNLIQKHIFCLFTLTLRWKFASSLKKWSPRNEDVFRFADWWFAQRKVSHPSSYRIEVVKSVPNKETG